MEHVEIYGMRVELSWPTSQWAQGDVAVSVVVSLRDPGLSPSASGSWLRWVISAAQAMLPWLGGARPPAATRIDPIAASSEPVAVTTGVAVEDDEPGVKRDPATDSPRERPTMCFNHVHHVGCGTPGAAQPAPIIVELDEMEESVRL